MLMIVVKSVLVILGIAGLIGLGALAQTERPTHAPPQHVSSDPNGGTPGPHG